jgi:hypothetical protein
LGWESSQCRYKSDRELGTKEQLRQPHFPDPFFLLVFLAGIFSTPPFAVLLFFTLEVLERKHKITIRKFQMKKTF